MSARQRVRRKPSAKQAPNQLSTKTSGESLGERSYPCHHAPPGPTFLHTSRSRRSGTSPGAYTNEQPPASRILSGTSKGVDVAVRTPPPAGLHTGGRVLAHSAWRRPTRIYMPCTARRPVHGRGPRAGDTRRGSAKCGPEGRVGGETNWRRAGDIGPRVRLARPLPLSCFTHDARRSER
jgi:hypothetical protein